MAVTKGIRSEDGMESSRLVIDSMSKPREYFSRASSKVQCSGPHCTRYSSTHVLCRPCRTRLGLLRARMRWIEALSPGASLPLRGSIVVFLLRLEELCLWDAPFFFLEGIFSRILLCWVSRSDARVAAQCERELSMESCLVALSSARGEGRSRRDSQSGLKIVRHRGAIE